MPAMKTHSLDKHQAQLILNKLFQQIQEFHNQSHTPQTSDLENIVTRNFELTCNGQVICHNLNEYHSRVEKLRKKFSKIKFTAYPEAPLFDENRIAARYTLNLTPRSGGQPTQVEIMAFAQLDGERVSEWHEVAHEKGAGHWDA